MDLPSSLNSAFRNARAAAGERAQGVDVLGCLVLCVIFFL